MCAATEVMLTSESITTEAMVTEALTAGREGLGHRPGGAGFVLPLRHLSHLYAEERV